MFNLFQFNTTQLNNEGIGVKARTRKGRRPKVSVSQRRKKPRMAA